MYASMFQPSKELTDLHEIPYDHFAITVHPKAANSNFIQSAYFHITDVKNRIFILYAIQKL